MEDELRSRLARIHAALAKTVGVDTTEMRPTFYASEKQFGMIMNFGGTELQEEVANAAYSLISNIAHLKDYLKDWVRHSGGIPREVEQFVNGCFPLQIVIDLSNTDKHGALLSPRSGARPQIRDLRRALRLRARSGSGVGIAMDLRNGQLSKVGVGETNVSISGTVVSEDGTVLGDLLDLCQQAIAEWERFATDHGLRL